MLIAFVLGGCSSRPRPGDAAAARRGEEMMVAGRLIHVGAPVVLFTDPGGYDAYRVEKRFTPWQESSWQALVKAGKALDTPNRYGLRASGLSDDERERVRGGGWDLPLLQRTVDQFVLHYDVCGTSRQCFKVLHDFRGLSVHFLLDIDGTIYQTLDLKERAWHATTSNDRSVGIEIANMGAYAPGAKNPFDAWYERDEAGRATRITIPAALGDGGVRTPGFVGRPIRPELVEGEVQGQMLQMYDLTPEQYDSLTKLTAALCTVLPQIRCDYPRDEHGRLVTRKLPDEELAAFKGVIGHYHIQANKADPGPAMQWDRVIDGARRLMR
jgi:N-acetyl-anhydromuramyl-L-alanine amidase AmpD